MNHNTGFIKLVEDARSRVQETDVSTVKEMLDANETFHLIDVREESEWERGRLPEAEHIGKGVLEAKIESIIPNHEAHIVLYCGGGYRSVLAADNLKKMGYKNVISMDGGYRDWKEHGYEIVDSA